VRDVLKPVTDNIAEPIKEAANPFSAGAAMAAITGGSMALEGTAAVAAYEGAKVSGFIASSIAKDAGANEEVQRHVDMVTEAISVPYWFAGALKGIAGGLRAVGLAELALPIPGARPLAAASVAMAAGVEALDYWSSKNETSEAEAK
jgi:hypothetical protein